MGRCQTHEGETDDCEHRCKKLKADVHKTAVFADCQSTVEPLVQTHSLKG